MRPQGLRQANGTTEAAAAADTKTATDTGATSAIAANHPVSEVSKKISVKVDAALRHTMIAVFPA
jgi:hypothetical protein